MGKLQIDIWSDIACPWCYVGKKRLDKALEALEGDTEVDVCWHAYMIDQRTDPAGEEYLAYNTRRWGGDGWTQDLRRSGRRDGATFADWQWWPATRHAHRLVALASKHGKGHAATELLFQLTYEQGRNVSDVDTLVRAGQQLGLPGVEEFMRSDAGTAEVLADDLHGKQQLGISGVPFFMVKGAAGGKAYSLSGAQQARAFQQVFEQALAEGQ